MLSQPSEAATSAALSAAALGLADRDCVGLGLFDSVAVVEGLEELDVDDGVLHAAIVRVRQAIAAMATGFM